MSVTGLKIKSVKARAVNVPLSAPHPIAGRTVTSAPLVLIDLHTDCGITGRTLAGTNLTPETIFPVRISFPVFL
jgi:hypothetical protein